MASPPPARRRLETVKILQTLPQTILIRRDRAIGAYPERERGRVPLTRAALWARHEPSRTIRATPSRVGAGDRPAGALALQRPNLLSVPLHPTTAVQRPTNQEILENCLRIHYFDARTTVHATPFTAAPIEPTSREGPLGGEEPAGFARKETPSRLFSSKKSLPARAPALRQPWTQSQTRSHEARANPARFVRCSNGSPHGGRTQRTTPPVALPATRTDAARCWRDVTRSLAGDLGALRGLPRYQRTPSIPPPAIITVRKRWIQPRLPSGRQPLGTEGRGAPS